jgi:hypothetical protein
VTPKPTAPHVHVEIVGLDALQPDPENARVHNPRNIGMLEDSIHAVGAARSGVIDEDGIIRAGNGMHEAAIQAGLTQAIVVDTDGTMPVFVRRSGLSREQKVRLAIDDNRIQELSTFDAEGVAALAEEFPNIRQGWTDIEWAKMLAEAEAPQAVNDPKAEWVGMPEFQQADQKSWHKLAVHFRTPADLAHFAGLIGQPVAKTVKWIWHPAEEHAVFKDKHYTAEPVEPESDADEDPSDGPDGPA